MCVLYMVEENTDFLKFIPNGKTIPKKIKTN